jgi:hypothetical protein
LDDLREIDPEGAAPSYRLCGVPTGTLLMIKASRDNALATTTLTLEPSEIVHAIDLHLTR